MLDFILNISPIILALFGGVFAFLFSVCGAMIVLFFKEINNRLMNLMLALSAGVMLAASIFSLLIPAIDSSKELYNFPLFIVLLGFITGGLLIFISNKFFKKFYNSKLNISRIFSLFTSITLHNIPEGLVIGVAFGSLFYDRTITCLIAAISLTLGIALQNFPEGSSLSLPLRRSGLSSNKSFLLSCLSASVEPIAALIGAFVVLKVKFFLPFILTFAAGAMIYVTCMELIPDCLEDDNKDLMTIFIIFGFSLMMILEFITI